ncbi:CDP-alcohol phosphatidyltransferase family protein [Sphingomonas sp. LHG3406-1]|uniref:CDP-alcohol phosphatidyltransferase family protein n=1 Tax=Sphingomonas sp. LHG3406-1 TaxID=2804617 RepID=UPI0026043B2A|nr:CDP-alcohol phosphatidyltransferase family protein [Sphingomonas sp. LHG3406-1]
MAETSASLIQFLPLGDPEVRLFGRTARARAEQVALKAGLAVGGSEDIGRSRILADMGFAWDPAWLAEMKQRPGSVLMLNGKPVMAHLPAGTAGEGLATPGLEPIDGRTASLSYFELRKRERPFVMPLDPDDPLPVERALYDASYKGVTDLLTLYLWRRPAFWLTRWAAQAGMTPNQVTLIGLLFCVAAFYFFWVGQYWLGTATGFVFMVLDTVDGKLARCTGQSSKWGDVFDHGTDLLHPPFWWWAWLHGLGAAGHQLEEVYKGGLLAVIVGTYVLGRLIEGWFKWRFKMHIHVWQRIDSQFRLVTARRNPNMVILVACLALGRPDWGIELVALWSVLSLIFHSVRLAQAEGVAARGRKITSWLDAA